jgi:hypothetical protein
MPLIQTKSLSCFTPVQHKIGLPGVELKQSTLIFNGGASFTFTDAFSGIEDVQTKNYTTFFLTKKSKLEPLIIKEQKTIQPPNTFTKISIGERQLSILPVSGINILLYESYYGLDFRAAPEYYNYFRITYHSNNTCDVSYDDGVSLSYLTLSSNSVCVLKRGIATSQEDRLFTYISGKNKIALFKNIGGITHQLIENNGVLSATPVTGNISNLIADNSLNIDNTQSIQNTNNLNTSFISYNPQNVEVDISNSLFDLENNYLFYKNLSKNTLQECDVLVLKNQKNDLGTITQSNNLSISSNNTITDYRAYTSICNDIDQLEDEGLVLNYVSYNKSITIYPGENVIQTEKSLYPFSQININDTKLAKSGSYSSTSPQYSDKIYWFDENNKGERHVYLCSWLSGSSESNNRLWVDRYYYPDVITKEQALIGQSIYSNTYTDFIESIITNNPIVKSNVTNNQFFDKPSDLVLLPDTLYIYDRVDFNNTFSLDSKNRFSERNDRYYQDINRNHGFTFACNIINQNDSREREIKTTFNEIQGGLLIRYKTDTITLQYSLYNTQTSQLYTIEHTQPIQQGIDSNVVVHVDNKVGKILMYINGIRVKTEYVSPLLYSTLVYGIFDIEGEPLFSSQNYITDGFLSTEPLSEDEVSLLIARLNTGNTDLVISLPCGMRNFTDTINQINSLSTNLKSKSTAIDILISDLNIEDEEIINTIKNSVSRAAEELLPVNVDVNTIEVL